MRKAAIVLLSLSISAGCNSQQTVTPVLETSNKNLGKLERGELVVTGQEVYPGTSETQSTNLEFNLDGPEWAKIIKRDNLIIVRIEDDRIFNFEQLEFNERAQASLDELLAVFSILPERSHLKIEAHTGDRADDDFNLNLTKNRANSLLRHFEKQEELSHISFDAEGLGEAEPIVPNTNDENQFINSRFDFIIKVPSKG